MKCVVLGIALIFGGCVSSQETFTPSGQKGHVISCPSQGAFGNMTHWGTCFQRAGEICGARGYTVLTRSDEPGFSAAVGQYGGYAGTTTNRMMIVQCNDGTNVAAPQPAPAPARR
jgi:hypothetical protein